MQVSFTIDDKIIGRLDVIARGQNRSRSQLIKVLIKDYLMKYNYTSNASGIKENESDVCEHPNKVRYHDAYEWCPDCLTHLPNENELQTYEGYKKEQET